MDWDSKTVDNKAILLGSSYNTAGSICLRVINNNDMALLSSPGNNPNNTDKRKNEDSIGGLIDNELGLSLVVIADSHFGGLIADAMILSFIQNYNRKTLSKIFNNINNSESEIIRNFQLYFNEKINEALTDILPRLQEETNETVGDTTLLIAVKFKNDIYWISIGDSVLYVFNENNYDLVNKPQFEFLGIDNAENINQTLNYGITKLFDNSIIVLTTDGLLQSIDKQVLLEGSDLIELIEYGNPQKTIKNLIHTFYFGGNENLGIIVFSS